MQSIDTIRDNRNFLETLFAPILGKAEEEYLLTNRRIRNARLMLSLALAFAVAFVGLILLQHAWISAVEPFNLAGTSIWPAMIIRAIGVLLAIGFLLGFSTCLRSGILELSRKFGLTVRSDRTPFSVWRQICNLCWRPIHNLWPVRKAISIQRWGVDGMTIEAEKLWEEFQSLGCFRARLCRIIPTFLGYMLFGWLVFGYFGPPFRPYRGDLSSRVDLGVLFAFVILYVVVSFFVIDIVRLCRQLIVNLSQGPTIWPESASAGLNPNAQTLGPYHLEELLEMQLVADLTERVGKLIYVPFILVCLMFVARSQLFDQWGWPPAMWIILGCNATLAGYSVFALQYTALRARRASLNSLKAKLADLEGAKAKAGTVRKTRQAIEECIGDIENLHTGAFASFWHNPVLGAILVPSGSYALFDLIVRAVAGQA